MKIDAQFEAQMDSGSDLAVFFIAEEAEKQQAELKRLDGITADIASLLVKEGLAKGKHNHACVVPTLGKMKPNMVGLIGLGALDKLSLEKIRQLGGTIARQAKAHKATTITIDFEAITSTGQDATARVLVEGLLLGNYDFRQFKTKKDEDAIEIQSVTLVVDKESFVKSIQAGIDMGMIEARATITARDMVNTPPAHLYPAKLKEAAEKLAHSSGGMITLQVFDRAALREMGAGAILGVAQGSEHEPFLLHLEYKPPHLAESTKSVALIGKGVTFDSGGLSLKPSEGMVDMKMDMAGAAVVLGVFSALTELKPQVHIHGVMACVENMISGTAIRLGDVIKTMSGKTVEVQNTDAEGRLILADALTYTEKLNPSVMLDFATLTGACMVALGHQIAGLMGNDEALIESIKKASEGSGEMLCELPLVEEYEEDMQSDVADLSNVHKGHYGGAIFGGLFLKQFVTKTKWAHFDIAGPAFTHKAFNSYTAVGATGFGVRTALHWLQDISSR